MLGEEAQLCLTVVVLGGKCTHMVEHCMVSKTNLDQTRSQMEMERIFNVAGVLTSLRKVLSRSAEPGWPSDYLQKLTQQHKGGVQLCTCKCDIVLCNRIRFMQHT